RHIARISLRNRAVRSAHTHDTQHAAHHQEQAEQRQGSEETELDGEFHACFIDTKGPILVIGTDLQELHFSCDPFVPIFCQCAFERTAGSRSAAGSIAGCACGSAAISRFNTARACFMSSCPSQRATTSVATPLPIRFVTARASFRKRSTP